MKKNPTASFLQISGLALAILGLPISYGISLTSNASPSYIFFSCLILGTLSYSLGEITNLLQRCVYYEQSIMLLLQNTNVNEKNIETIDIQNPISILEDIEENLPLL